MSTRFFVAEVCILALCASSGTRAEHLGDVPLHHVIEIELEGPELSAKDVPARRPGFTVEFQHESERSAEPVTGFWDGDGKGGVRGGVFKVRFSPGKVGRWKIVGVHGPVAEFDEQRKGDTFDCVLSDHPGRWIAEGRWYRRSDGSRPYIVGNTHYTFLSRQSRNGRERSDPVADVRANARFYKKLRFSLVGGRYPDSGLKPFLDDGGDETDDGRYSFRPNPRWFRERVDPVVAEAFRQDLICDLILCGPDTREARSTLAGSPDPWLRYVAARYSAYPNVWYCLANEWNIKKPRYSAEAIRDAGDSLRVRTLSRNPVSVHGDSGDWESDLAGRWHDHAIIQLKTRRLDDARDAIVRNWARVRQPIFNDENGYQGDGDGFSLGDVVEGCFGTFLGGGYSSTGEKYGGKLGQYFWGGFDARVHSASARLLLLRDFINREVRFWELAPVELSAIEGHPFAELPGGGHVLENPGEEYVIGCNTALHAVPIALPPGVWRVRQVDLMAQTVQTLAAEARGQMTFSCPDSRASLTHFRRLADAAGRTCAIEEIFTPQSLHNHGSSIVECPNGDLLVSWYNGSGERNADDVKILGARLRRDATRWSEPFLMADTPGFPDCNSALFIDPAGKLWLFWPLIVANRWETALLQSRTASEFERDGPPSWEAEKTILLKPGQRFVETVERAIAETGLEGAPRLAKEIAEEWFAKIREMAKDKYTRRMGWMPRVKPLAVEGRIILPLYSDGFDFSMMALSDDGGTTWRASEPLVGGGNVQPSLARRSDGTIVAYMRDNGLPPQRLLYSESKDRGETWSLVVDTGIPNPGSGAEVLRLRDGRWVLIHNDTERGRRRLAVWMSEDEGKTWPWKRALEPRGDVDGELSASYPTIVEGKDGTIHASYTHSVPGRGSTIRHAAFTPRWVMGE